MLLAVASRTGLEQAWGGSRWGGYYHTRVVRRGRESQGWHNWSGMGRPDWGGKGWRLGVSGRDGTSVRCRSAGVEYPKDYSWLMRPLSDRIWAPVLPAEVDPGIWGALLLVRLIKPGQKVLNLQYSPETLSCHRSKGSVLVNTVLNDCTGSFNDC